MEANRACAVEFKGSLGSGPWTTLTNVTAVASNRVIEFVAPAPGDHGFYRLRSP